VSILLSFLACRRDQRKFGRGCVDDWERNAGELIARARAMLVPTAQTLGQRSFIFGDRPTLADAALYGQCAMLRGADAAMPAALAPALSAWMARVEAAAQRLRGPLEAPKFQCQTLPEDD
jgi:glutathione S-transferase